MPDLHIITHLADHTPLVEEIIPRIAQNTGLDVSLIIDGMDLSPFRDATRQQYDAARIIHAVEPVIAADKAILVTDVDIFIPIFTHVFGLAKLGGKLGVVSKHRLCNEPYGLPCDEDLLKDRLTKEIIHELGHLLNLRHCNDYTCVMSSSTAADELDVKGAEYCEECNRLIRT